MLTRKQKELLFLIRDRLAEDGVPPSFDEMKLALGLRSKSGIHRLITALEERGFIKRLPHRARALEVLRMPEAKDCDPGEKDSGSLGRAGRSFGGDGFGGDVPAHVAQAVLSLPLYGRIAAGTPIEALSDPSRFIDVPVGLLASRRGGGAHDEHYALEISGDSMIDAGILDGDQVVIRKADRVENGAIAVALVDDAEATLKYIQKRADGIALIPANKKYETRVLDPARVKIQGQLVGLVRRY